MHFVGQLIAYIYGSCCILIASPFRVRYSFGVLYLLGAGLVKTWIFLF